MANVIIVTTDDHNTAVMLRQYLEGPFIKEDLHVDQVFQPSSKEAAMNVIAAIWPFPQTGDNKQEKISH